MALSELVVHNVLRTYSRQDAVGRSQKARRSGPPIDGADHVTLSSLAMKIQSLGRVAAEMVHKTAPNLPAEEKAAQLLDFKAELFSRYRHDLTDDGMSPGDFELHLRRQLM